MAGFGTFDICKKRGCICAVGTGIQTLVDIWNDQLNELVSEQMKHNLFKRNGVNNYHCTLVSSTEMRKIGCVKSLIQQFQTLISSCFPIGLGIGKLQKGNNDKVFFLIVKWPEANRVRVNRSLEEKNFHITLGFSNMDIHQNENKGVTSLIPFFDVPHSIVQNIYFWSAQEKIVQHYPETAIDSLGAVVDHCSYSSNTYNELEAKARLERAILFGRQGIKDRCLHDALSSIELKPTPRAFLILGDSYLLLKKYKDANLSYQKGFALCKKASRIRTSLFKKIQTGDNTNKIQENFKFPRTKHIFNFGWATRDDLLLPVSEHNEFCSGANILREITVEEKIDGANLGIFFEDGKLVTKNRSKFICSQSDAQWKGLDTWLAKHYTSLKQILGNRYILYGEWLLAKHSIHYTCLPDYFIAFDIFCKISKRFLSVSCRNKMLANTCIKVVRCVTTIPVLTTATIESGLKEALRQESSHYYRGKVEGLVLRSDEKDESNGQQIAFLINRTKIVRPDFLKGIDEHWTRTNFEKNIIAFQHCYDGKNRERDQEFTSAKYPRTPKFLFSPNFESDDIPYNPQNAPIWFNEYVITEKIDGGNCCLKNGKVYARSHSAPASHWSFDRIKENYASTYMLNPVYETYGPDLELYGENVTAVHSIEYDNLSCPFYLFAAKINDYWLPWSEVVTIAETLEIPHVPVIFQENENKKGKFSLKNIEETLHSLANQTSQLATNVQPEGFVVRKKEGFSEADFQYSVAKYVRKGHVQTAINWKSTCKKAIIGSSKSIKTMHNGNDYLLYIDLDGVLADFDKGIKDLTGKNPEELANSQMWKAIRNAKNFYGSLDWMPDAEQFWKEELAQHQPTILTGIPEDESKWASRQKISWCHKHLGGNVPVICCLSKDKQKYGGPNRILIDDRPRNGRAWKKNGGIFILHTSVQNSIDQLKRLNSDSNCTELEHCSTNKEMKKPSMKKKSAKIIKPHYDLVMLVGVPGSGKSTFANGLEKRGYFRLSQDVVGSRKKCEEVIGGLCKRRSVVLDRCNVEGGDRKYWLSLSMTSKKKAVAVFFDRKVEHCASSIVHRLGHETIKTKNIQHATKIVQSFQKKLTPPSTNEGFAEVYRVVTFQQTSQILEKL